MQTRHAVRMPAVAGLFYPADRGTLTRAVDRYLSEGRVPAGEPVPQPRALVAPHAGYVYSGPVAGSAYRQLRRPPGDEGEVPVRRVLLLGPAHRWPLEGMAAPSVVALATPLGQLPVDAAGVDEALAASRWVLVDDRPHEGEHCLEVQLPFLQRTLGDVPVVPLVVGRVAAREVALVIAALAADPATLVVVSSDLSHYLPQAQADRVDAATAHKIVGRAAEELRDLDACGAYPLRGLLTVARTAGWHVRQLDLRTSADTAGTAERVVGYGAFLLAEGEPEADPDAGPATSTVTATATATAGATATATAGGMGGTEPTPGSAAPLTGEDERALLDLAVRSIAGYLATGRRPAVDLDRLSPALRAPGAVFVTLTRAGRLLGCIGSLEAYRPLALDVAEHACDAAFADPRLPPVTEDDLAEMDLEISLLSPPQPLAVGSYAGLVEALVPGRDGVVVRAAGRRATLLPSVWEDLPDPARFVAALWRKASLPAGSWPAGTRVETYRTRMFADPGPRSVPA